MKLKIIKLFKTLGLVFRSPHLCIKFIREISINGVRAAILKTKNKVIVFETTYERPTILSLFKAKKMSLDFSKCISPKISIIIPVFNNYPFTIRCLWSILENSRNIPYEIIIADDNSTDETVRIQDHVKNITVLRNSINRGFIKNCNHAAQHARGEFVLFLNNDTQVLPEWLDFLVGLIEPDDSIGLVGSKLIYPDGRLQEAGGIIWQDGSGWNYGKLDNPKKPEYNYVKEVDYVSGACLMTRKSVWNKIGGFDERYSPAYYEDVDFAFEVRKLGYKVVYQPKSVVIHFEGISNGSDENSGVKQFQIINNQKFLNKWRNELMANNFVNGENVFLARDRSRHKKHLLVIDHYIPLYDQDAGSRTMWQYLDLLREIGYEIIFIPDNFFPTEPYTSELQQKGIHVRYGKHARDFINEWLILNGKYFDVVLLSRPDVSIKYFDEIKKNSHAKVMYYGIDLHHVRMEREYALTGRSSLLNEIRIVKNQELYLFKNVDLVLMFNQDETDFINKYTKSEKAKTIKLFFYKHIPLVMHKGFDSKNPRGIFVGSFRHPPNIDGIIWFANSVMPLIKERMTDFSLVIIGSDPPQSVMDLSNASGINIMGYVDELTLKTLYQHSMIAVVPLRYGAGVKGKTVEAVSHGIPVVSTSIGAEGLSGIGDFIVVEDAPEKMAESILSLLEEKTIWEKSSKLAIDYAIRNFSYESARLEFEQLMYELCYSYSKESTKLFHIGQETMRGTD